MVMSALALPVLALAAANAPKGTIQETEFVAGNGNAQAFARCGEGRRALGGGIVQDGSPARLGLLASGPLDASGVAQQTGDGDVPKQWVAAVSNFDANQRTFRVFAICARAPGATIEATRFKVPGNSVGEASATCKGRNRRALGGGVVQIGQPGVIDLIASAPRDASGVVAKTNDGDVAKQWYAALLNGQVGELTFRVFAICAKAPGARIQAVQVPLFFDGEFEAYAFCPGRQRVLGGGAAQVGRAEDGTFIRASGPLDASAITLNTDNGDVAKYWYSAVGQLNGRNRAYRVFAICG
jgi:hypothetical protein